ncbi:N-alpha-acetyltransferase 80 [Prorops nasuta]|uniref:N-alpha-acetyltransferase 80 n=1 Tax=Prorops nasuta TaxID=863751 RepID=UPI0034CD7E29
MTDSEYKIVPLHRRRDLVNECCTLLNAEWPRSETARLKSLNVSCDNFPTCLILINTEDKVLGHCKISLISRLSHSCFIESFVIDYHNRSQGLGSRLLKGAEEYIAKRGLKSIYLITRGQEVFYFKNGYDVCDPIKVHNFTEFISPSSSNNNRGKSKNKNTNFGPPPPPMPNLQIPKIFDIMISRRTYMVKKL